MSLVCQEQRRKCDGIKEPQGYRRRSEWMDGTTKPLTLTHEAWFSLAVASPGLQVRHNQPEFL